MDWAAFFTDNSQSIFTLGGVFLGSAITFLINYLSLRNQSKERDKDREEARKEAKTQLALELMSRDIKIIEDVIDDALKAVDLVEILHLRKSKGELSDEDMQSELFSIDGKFLKLGELSRVADKLAYALSEVFYSEYESFNELVTKYMSMFVYSDLKAFASERQDREMLEDGITRKAGKLHNMLQEKLISIRDT